MSSRVLDALREEESELVAALEKVRRTIGEYGESPRRGPGPGRKPAKRQARRKLSAAGRAAISKAAKLRWAKYNKAKPKAKKKAVAKAA